MLWVIVSSFAFLDAKICICQPQILPGFGLNQHIKWVREIFVLCVWERVGCTLFACHQGTDRKQSCHSCYHMALPQKHSTNCHFSHWIPEGSSGPSAKTFLALHPTSQLPFSRSAAEENIRPVVICPSVCKGRVMDPCWKLQLNLAKWEIFVSLH